MAKHSKINRQISYWRMRDCIKIKETVHREKQKVVVKNKKVVNVQKLFNKLRTIYELRLAGVFATIISKAKAVEEVQQFTKRSTIILDPNAMSQVRRSTSAKASFMIKSNNKFDFEGL
jgi:hypothetical protein